ncbi:hypothetical protein NL533_32940, partial [Klebsiella pneumoniae]|nr:hypothetical protein [Klebsiella pneumoniae]
AVAIANVSSEAVTALSQTVNMHTTAIAQFQTVPDSVASLRLQLANTNDRLGSLAQSNTLALDQLRDDLHKRNWDKTALWGIELSHL